MKAVIFDLDGTLLDTIEDLADSVNQALEFFDFPTHPTEAYKLFVGNGMATLIRRALPDKQQNPNIIKKVSSKMTEIYTYNWHNKTKVYPGIMEMLEELNKSNIPISILSNKPDDFVKLCVKHFLPQFHFHTVTGTLPNIPAKPHPEAAIKICQSLDLSPKNCYFVGDSSVDMQTAKSAAMNAIGVTWGFRSLEELQSNGANFTVNKPSEILELLQ